MHFSSIRNMADYVFVSPKMNLWSDWWCFLTVSSQSFIVFTSNMILLNGKSFFRSQKYLRLILVYWCASVALEMWLVLYLYHQKWICGVTGNVFLLFLVKVLLYSLLICYFLMESYFSEVKKPQTHLLMSFSRLETWLVIHFNHQT